MPKTCGSDKLDEGELCDGEHFSEGIEYDCKSIFGPGSTGKLKCDSSCLHFDKSACTPPQSCGDGKVQINEKCDPNYNNQANELCSAYFSQGTEGKRKCDEMCRWDTSECIAPDHCGNGQVDKDLGEDCDPSSPQSYELTCEAVFGPGSVGTITCSNLCKYESSWCTVTTACGNDKVDNGQNGNPNYSEVCDPGDLKGKKCASLGTDYSGTLKCLSNCSGFDFSDCEILPQY
jgi:hypothetical protein